MVATGAAGVKDNLLRSGSSSDFRRRGEPDALRALPDGEVGLESCENWEGRDGIGRRRLGCRLEAGVEAGEGEEEEGLVGPGPGAALEAACWDCWEALDGREGEPCG